MAPHLHRSSESFVALLREQGFRATPVRTKLLELLCHAQTPVAVPEIVLQLKAEGTVANKTTIYREMEFLRSVGIVAAVRVDDTRVLYEIRSHDHHHHAVCTVCGTMVDIANPTLEKAITLLSDAVKETHGFEVHDHSVELFGLCRACAQKS